METALLPVYDGEETLLCLFPVLQPLVTDTLDVRHKANVIGTALTVT